MLDPIWQTMARVPTRPTPVANVDNATLWRIMNAISQAVTENSKP